MVKAGDKLPRSRLIEATVFLNYNFLKPRDNALSVFQTRFLVERALGVLYVLIKHLQKGESYREESRQKRRRQLIHLQSSPLAPFPGLNNIDLLSLSGDFTK